MADTKTVHVQRCRVCGAPKPILTEDAHSDAPVLDLCPCCKTPLGFDALFADDQAVVRRRRAWIIRGMKWLDEKSKPADWDAEEQLAHLLDPEALATAHEDIASQADFLLADAAKVLSNMVSMFEVGTKARARIGTVIGCMEQMVAEVKRLNDLVSAGIKFRNMTEDERQNLISAEFDERWPSIITAITMTFREAFERAGAKNCIEQSLSLGKGMTAGSEPEFTVTIVRRNGKSMSELKKEAEARLEDALAQVKNLSHDLSYEREVVGANMSEQLNRLRTLAASLLVDPLVATGQDPVVDHVRAAALASRETAEEIFEHALKPLLDSLRSAATLRKDLADVTAEKDALARRMALLERAHADALNRAKDPPVSHLPFEDLFTNLGGGRS